MLCSQLEVPQFSRALQSSEVDMKVRGIANASCLLLSLTVSSVSPARAAQSAQAGDQQSLAAIQAACAEDAQKLCVGVQPGGGRIVACLREHKDSLSDRCKQAAGLTANPSSSSAPSPSSASPASQTPASSAPVAPSAAAAPPAKSSHGSGAAPKVGATGTASGSYLRMKQVQIGMYFRHLFGVLGGQECGRVRRLSRRPRFQLAIRG